MSCQAGLGFEPRTVRTKALKHNVNFIQLVYERIQYMSCLLRMNSREMGVVCLADFIKLKPIFEY